MVLIDIIKRVKLSFCQRRHFSACCRGVKTVNILEYFAALWILLPWMYLTDLSGIIFVYYLDMYLSASEMIYLWIN